MLHSAASRSRPASARPTDATRAVDALRRLVRALRTAPAHAEAERASVTTAQLLVLRELGDAPGISLGELARRTETTQSTVSEVVTRLVRSGLVTRRVSAADGRRRELTLTARGRGFVARAPRSTAERLRGALEAMPSARQRAIAAGLEEWLAAAGLDTRAATLILAPSDGAPRRRAPR